LRAVVERLQKEEGKKEVSRRARILEKSGKLVNGMLRAEVRRHRGKSFKSKGQRGFEVQSFNAKEEMAKTNPDVAAVFY
jgi:hypothetical protein